MLLGGERVDVLHVLASKDLACLKPSDARGFEKALRCHRLGGRGVLLGGVVSKVGEVFTRQPDKYG